MSLPTKGLHESIPEAEYHSDPRSLSSTGAKVLLFEGPRAYKWKRDHPAHKDAFDLGTVAHALILGAGDYVVLDYPDWRTKAAQAERDQVRADGGTPILRKDVALAEAMRDSAYASPLAAAILSEGRAEVSMWATDPETGVAMRGRADWLRDNALVDLKTSGKPVDPKQWERTAWDFHYGFQAWWYQRVLELNGEPERPFLWIAVSTSAPHECYIHEASPELLDRSREDGERALRLYADCLASGKWPGLADDQEIHQTGLPRWAR